jgi:hypothetical protein
MAKITVTDGGVATGPVNTSEGIIHIKMSKTDENGVDKTTHLATAQTLTLSYPNGEPAGIYHIIDRVEEESFFTLKIDNVNYNTFNTASDSSYVRHDYGLSIEQSSIEYKPINTSGNHVYNVFLDPFSSPTVSGDSNGKEQISYWKNYEGVAREPNRFYWGNTPSIPMEYTASFAYRNTDGLAGSRNLHVGIYKVGENETFAPAPNTVNNFGSPQEFNEFNLISSKATVNGGNNIQGTILANFTEVDEGDINDEPFSTPIFPGWRVVTIKGVTDAIKGEAVGLTLKISSNIPGSTVSFSDTSVVELSTLRFNINPHYVIGNEGGNPSFPIIAPPSEGEVGSVLFAPNIDVDDPFFYNEEPYEFSINNPLANNVDLYEKSKLYQKSLRDKTSINPFNINAIISNIAEPAGVKDYYYLVASHVNGRYKGAKNTSADFNLNSKDGLGLPPAEGNTNIFLNCLGAGGQSPEVRNATAFFFNKVIDERLDVYPSVESDIPQFLDVQYAFAPGTKANVNISPKDNKFIAYDGLSGIHKILGIGKLETLITTGQGINPWNYVNQTEFEGADVENFQDFWYKKTFANASIALGTQGGVLRFYKNSPWVKENPSNGNLEGTNEIPAVGESSVEFTGGEWQDIPFPDQVISVNPDSTADAGYTWNSTGYTFDFDTSDSTASPEVQFLAEIPILWLGHPAYRYGGSDDGGEWQPSDNQGENVFSNDINVFNPLALSFKLEVRLLLIKGGAIEENVEILKWPNSETDYTGGENDNVLSFDRGVFGHAGLQLGGAFGPNYSPTETPIYIKSKPRTYENGDTLKIQARFAGFSGNNYSELISNSSRARKLIKLIKVKNLTLDYDPPGQTTGNNGNTTEDIRPAQYTAPGQISGFIDTRQLNFENRYYFKALYQDPTPTDIVPIPSDGRWASLVEELGDTTHLIQNNLSLVCLSSALTNMAVVKDTQILSGSQESFSVGGGLTTGYSKELLVPFDPQPGDQIRFSYNEDFTRTITEVFLPGISGVGPGGDFETTRVYLQLDRPLPPLDEEVNHFIIRRFNKDNTQITMDVNKIPTPPNAPSGETNLSTITPIYLTEKLKNNFSQIIRDLNDEGVL